MLTIGSGASSCLHMTHGTPVPSPKAICAAHFEYAFPGAPSSYSIGPYSFSIYTKWWKRKMLHYFTESFHVKDNFKKKQMHSERKENPSILSVQSFLLLTWDKIIGPPWDSYNLSAFIIFTIFLVNLSIWNWVVQNQKRKLI